MPSQRNARQRIGAMALLLAAMIASPANAQETPQSTTIRIGRDELKITSGNGFQQVRFRGQSIAEGDAISLAGRLTKDGAEAVIFTVRPGGPCPGGVLVISAAANADARFDRRLIDACSGFEILKGDASFTLIDAATPAHEGALWRVTAADGLTLAGRLHFAPEPGTGFGELKPADIEKGPGAVLRNQAVWEAFGTITRADLKAYAAALSVADAPVPTSTPLLAAAGCFAADACKRQAALLIVDPVKRMVYVALRIGAKRSTRPDAKVWPENAKAVLAAWEARLH